MITTELIAYIQQELALGMNLDELKEKLAQSGWTDESIEEGLVTAAHPSTRQFAASHISLSQRITNEFNSLISESIQLYKGNLKTIIIIQSVQLGIYIASIVISVVIYLLFSLVLGQGITALSIIILTVLSDIVLAVISIIPHLSLVYAIADMAEHQYKIEDYFRKSIANIYRYLLVILIPWLIIIGAVILYIIIFAVLFMIIKTFFSEVIFLSALLLPLGYFIGIVFSIIVFGWYSLSIYVFVVENTGIIETAKRSKFLTRNNLLRIFLHGLLVGITFVVLIIIPFIGIFISMFFTIPLANIYFYKLYSNIKSLKK